MSNTFTSFTILVTIFRVSFPLGAPAPLMIILYHIIGDLSIGFGKIFEIILFTICSQKTVEMFINPKSRRSRRKTAGPNYEQIMNLVNKL
jgi:hypothetical protein